MSLDPSQMPHDSDAAGCTASGSLHNRSDHPFGARRKGPARGPLSVYHGSGRLPIAMEKGDWLPIPTVAPTEVSLHVRTNSMAIARYLSEAPGLLKPCLLR